MRDRGWFGHLHSTQGLRSSGQQLAADETITMQYRELTKRSAEAERTLILQESWWGHALPGNCPPSPGTKRGGRRAAPAGEPDLEFGQRHTFCRFGLNILPLCGRESGQERDFGRKRKNSDNVRILRWTCARRNDFVCVTPFPFKILHPRVFKIRSPKVQLSSCPKSALYFLAFSCNLMAKISLLSTKVRFGGRRVMKVALRMLIFLAVAGISVQSFNLPLPPTPVPGVQSFNLPLPPTPVPGIQSFNLPLPPTPVPGVQSFNLPLPPTPVPGVQSFNLPLPPTPVPGAQVG